MKKSSTPNPAQRVPTEKELIKAFDKYLVQLMSTKGLSTTKFNHMQLAITGCKFIVNDLYGSKRKSVNAMVK